MARPRVARAAPPAADRARARLGAVGAVGRVRAFLAAYVALTPAVAGDKDSGEFAFVLATFGAAHPTGYPLYTLLGGLFVHALHAAGFAWAHAANLWSAELGAIAMALLYALTARLVRPVAGARGAAWLAFLPPLAFGLNPLWTLETTLAEVNAMHLAWVAGAALAAGRVLEAFARPGASTRARAGAGFAWGLVVGVGLAHHVTSVFFAAPLTLAVAVAAARGGAGRLVAPVLAGALGCALPLGSYAWIAWRASHPAAAQWPALEPGVRGLLDHVTGAQFRGFLGRFAPSPTQAALLAQHVYPWLGPALAGAVGAAFGRDDRAWSRALGLGVVLQVGYAFLYGVSDPATYFLPALAIGLVLALAGAARLGPVRRRGRALAVAAALALLVPATGDVRLALERRAAYERLDDLLRRMWAALPAGPSFVVWDDDMAVRLVALQALEGSRPDVEVVAPRHLTYPAARARFRARHGFDPLAGIAPTALAGAQGDPARSAALVEAIAQRIDDAGDRPVVMFLPAVPSMRLLPRGERARPE